MSEKSLLRDLGISPAALEAYRTKHPKASLVVARRALIGKALINELRQGRDGRVLQLLVEELYPDPNR